MALVFVSYSRQQQEFVFKLVADLKQAGVPVWLDQTDITPGQRWDIAIEHALQASTHMLIIISKASADSANVRDEIDLALDSGKSIIPVRVDDAELPLRIRRMQWTDFRDNYASALERLLTALPRGQIDPIEAEASQDKTAKSPPIAGTTSLPVVPTRPTRRPLAVLLSLLLLVIVGIAAMIILPKVAGNNQTPTATSAGEQTALAVVPTLFPTTLIPTLTTPTERANPQTPVALTRTMQGSLTAISVASQFAADEKATIQVIVDAQDTETANSAFSTRSLQVTNTATPTVSPATTTTPTSTWSVTPTLPSTTPTAAPSAMATLTAGMERTDSAGIKQVFVPPGCFTMGSDPKNVLNAYPDEQPAHEVCITQGYWIDRFEVTNAAYQKFIEADGYQQRKYWSNTGWAWLIRSRFTGPAATDYRDPDQPRGGLSFYEAEAYAHWRSGRLPTEAEWEYAARGPDSRIYTWGDQYTPNRANIENIRPNPVVVGSFPAGKSWVNAEDMIGNIWEWTTDWYSASYYKTSPKDDPQGPSEGISLVMRGRSWQANRNDARAAARGVSSVDNRFPGVRVITPAQ